MPGARARGCCIGVAVVAACALAVPAQAGHLPLTTIEASDYTFTPRTPSRPLGTAFNWHNSSIANDHTATRQGVISWDFFLNPQDTSPMKTLEFAGSYFYYCDLHRFDNNMVGTIKIPLRAFEPPNVNDNTGSTATNFRITLGTRDASSGQQFEIQRRKGVNGAWQIWKRTTSQRTTFRAGNLGPGSYFFRSRVRRVANTNGATGYSPQRKLIVN